MWTLIIITVLNTNPVKIMYDPIATFQTVEQCNKTADVVAKHNSNSQLLCVKDN
jgi:hypothetical protein